METIASEIMSTELLTANEKMPVEDALKLMLNNRITGMPVVNDDGKMVGVVSEYDVLVMLSDAKDLKGVDFKKPIAFSKSTQAIRETTPLSEIVTMFVNSKFRRLPVVDAQGKLLGIITRRDLMRVFYYRAKLS